jgi:hypothetical protein
MPFTQAGSPKRLSALFRPTVVFSRSRIFGVSGTLVLLRTALCLVEFGVFVSSDYKVHVKDALSVPYRNHTVYSCQAPSSGSLVLSILNTMSGFPANHSDVDIHRLVEAVKVRECQFATLCYPPGLILCIPCSSPTANGRPSATRTSRLTSARSSKSSFVRRPGRSSASSFTTVTLTRATFTTPNSEHRSHADE